MTTDGMITGGMTTEPLDEAGRSFVAAWSTSLYGSGYAPLTLPERRQLLTKLVGRLHTALTTEPARLAATGRQVGAELVASGFAAPEALGCTLTVLSERLASDLRLPPPAALACPHCWRRWPAGSPPRRTTARWTSRTPSGRRR